MLREQLAQHRAGRVAAASDRASPWRAGARLRSRRARRSRRASPRRAACRGARSLPAMMLLPGRVVARAGLAHLLAVARRLERDGRERAAALPSRRRQRLGEHAADALDRGAEIGRRAITPSRSAATSRPTPRARRTRAPPCRRESRSTPSRAARRWPRRSRPGRWRGSPACAAARGRLDQLLAAALALGGARLGLLLHAPASSSCARRRLLRAAHHPPQRAQHRAPRGHREIGLVAGGQSQHLLLIPRDLGQIGDPS